LEVQRAIWSQLAYDEALQSLVRGVYSQGAVPPNLTGDYVVLGQKTESAGANTHSRFGREITITIHAWARTSEQRAIEITERLMDLLERQRLNIGGGWEWQATFFEHGELSLDSSAEPWWMAAYRFRVRVSRVNTRTAA
jgi:hypothetical protein